MTKTKTVPVDEMFCEMMNWAVRYALGRRTYAASDTCGYIKPLIPHLDDQTLHVMLQDIQLQGRIGDYGDSIDMDQWMSLKSAIIDELKKRKQIRAKSTEPKLLTPANGYTVVISSLQ